MKLETKGSFVARNYDESNVKELGKHKGDCAFCGLMLAESDVKCPACGRSAVTRQEVE